MAGTLKLELAQFREVEGFTKSGLVLDDATKHLVDRGSKLTSLLIQKRYAPLHIFEQILLLYVSLNGFLDKVSTEYMNLFEVEFLNFFRQSIYYSPISRSLNLMIFPKELVPFMLINFVNQFIIYLKVNY